MTNIPDFLISNSPRFFKIPNDCTPSQIKSFETSISKFMGILDGDVDDLTDLGNPTSAGTKYYQRIRQIGSVKFFEVTIDFVEKFNQSTQSERANILPSGHFIGNNINNLYEFDELLIDEPS